MEKLERRRGWNELKGKESPSSICPNNSIMPSYSFFKTLENFGRGMKAGVWGVFLTYQLNPGGTEPHLLGAPLPSLTELQTGTCQHLCAGVC